MTAMQESVFSKFQAEAIAAYHSGRDVHLDSDEAVCLAGIISDLNLKLAQASAAHHFAADRIGLDDWRATEAEADLAYQQWQQA